MLRSRAPSIPSRAASATMAMDAKNVALCTVWPIRKASVIRLSRPSIVRIQARRTSFMRAVMLPLHGTA